MIRFIAITLGLGPLLAQSQSYFPTTDGGWETTTALAAGADPALLAEAVAYAEQANSDALVILHGGRILTEQYWNGATRLTKTRLYSASKAMVAALVGKLVEEGAFNSLEQRTSDFIPEWREVPRKSEIPLRHHLEMTTGLEGGKRNLFLGAIARDERNFAINLPQEHTPGTYWTYNNPAYRLLFPIIQSATGESLSSVFNAVLASPLGMSDASWAIRTTQIELRPVVNYQSIEANALSAARFGLLVLRDGRWNDKQVIPSAFLAKATTTSQSINPSYGFLWWLNNGASEGGHQMLFDGVPRAGPYFPDAPPDTFAALGLNDQIIAVIPSLDLVIVRQGVQPLDESSEAISVAQNSLFGKIARAFGYAGQPQEAELRIALEEEGIRLTWTSWLGRQYSLENSKDLKQDSWEPITPGPIDGNGLDLSWNVSLGQTPGFWRLRHE